MAWDPRIDGWNVNRVTVGWGDDVVAVFRQVARQDWIEEGPSGGDARFRFFERNRDDWSVYLYDESRDVNIQLDLHTRKVTYSDPSTSFELYDLIKAEAEVNGLLTNFVAFGPIEHPDGFFQQTGPGRWDELGQDGGLARYHFTETGRDDWSVYLYDESRSVSLQIDLHTKKITYSDPSTSFELYTISAAEVGIPGSLSGMPEATLEVVNEANATVELCWIDFVGHAEPRVVLAPGESTTLSTFVGHMWVARDLHSRRRLGAVSVSDTTDRLVVNTIGLRSTGGVPVSVTYKSLYPRTLRLVWMATDGEEVEVAKLAPGRHVSLTGASGDVIRCYDRLEEAELVVLGVEPTQYRELTFGPARLPDTTFEVHNSTPLTVRMLLVAPSGRERQYRRLDPGEVVDQPAVAGEVWTFREARSRRLLQSYSVPTDASMISLSTIGLRSKPSKFATRVSFRNRTAVAGRLYRVRGNGRETDLGRIEPGKKLVRRGHGGDVWRFREETTGIELGLFIGLDKDRTVSTFTLEAIHSRKPSRLTIRNRTLLTVEMFWLDASGAERSAGLLPALASHAFDTHTTHPWIVRERDSGIVLDMIVCRLPDETVTIDGADLARAEIDDEVAVEFSNQLGFNCEICPIDDPNGEPIAVLRAGEEVRLPARTGQGFAFRESTARGVFRTYMCTSASEQGFALVPATRDTGVATRIEFSNESSFGVDLFWLDHEGTEHSYGQVPPKSSSIRLTGSGSMWVVKESRSGEVVGSTQGFGVPQRLRITPDRLYSRRSNTAVDVGFHNTTTMPLDLSWVAFDGERQYYGTVQPGATFRVSTFHTHVWRLTKSVTDLEVDVIVVGPYPEETIEVSNGLMTPIDTATLPKSGEVIFYTGVDFTGEARIVRTDIDDVSAVAGLDFASLRVGVGTGLTAYRYTGFAGPDDVFSADVPQLAVTDAGVGFDSFRLFTVAPPPQHLTRVDATLTEEHRLNADGALESYSAYRTVVSFNEAVTSVAVRATEQIDVEVAGKPITLYPTHDTTLTPNSAGSLMFLIAADRLGTPSLMMRTNTMARNHWFFVYPDQSAVAKLRSLDEDAIWDNSDKLGIDTSVIGRDTCAHVQKAVTQLAAAVPQRGATGVTAKPVDVTGMDFQAWSLELEAGSSFTPLGPTEAAAHPIGRVIDDDAASWNLFKEAVKAVSSGAKTVDRVVVRPAVNQVDKAATDFDAHVIKPAVKFAEQTATEFDRKVIQPAVTTIDEEVIEPVATAFEEGRDKAGEAIGNVVDQVGEGLEEIGDRIDEIRDNVDEVLDQVLAVSATIGGEVITAIIDTAEKVGDVVEVVVTQIGVAIEKFVGLLESLFDWDDILAVHDVILDVIDQTFADTDGMVDRVEAKLMKSIKRLRGTPTDAARGASRRQFASSSSDSGGGEGDSILARVMDWLGEDGGPNPLPSVSAPRSELAAFDRGLRGLAHDVGRSFDDAFGPVAEKLAGLSHASPPELPGKILDILMSVFEGLVDLAFEVLEALAALLFDLLRASLGAIRAILAAHIDVPILSQLYGTWTGGRQLSLASIVALVIAVPANAVGRATLGDRFRPAPGLSAQLDPATVQSMCKVASVARGLRGILAPFAVLTSAASGASRGTMARKGAGVLLLFITDVILAVAHAFDYPAYDLRSRSRRGVAEAAKAAAWIFGGLAILASVVAYFGDLAVSGFADIMSPIVSIIWIPSVVFCLIGAIMSLAASPPSGSGWDLGVIITQGAADIVGVPGPGFKKARAGVGFVANFAAAAFLGIRSGAAQTNMVAPLPARTG